MQYCNNGMDFETVLAGEWSRLIRLCTWFTGQADIAEDLAQDTLVAAWKNKGQLASLDQIKPWTSAIARNICLNWIRESRREQAQIVSSLDESQDSLEEEFQDETNLEVELDRNELAKLLDRALSLLPKETGQMLIEHYLNEASQAEIAARLNIKPGTVAVRLQRGKLTLQRLLRTDLKAEALVFGLIREQDTEWVETNIWCICCGKMRLVGKYQKNKIFALRCPHCTRHPEAIMVGMDLGQPYYAKVVGKVKKFKPAYSRLLAALAPLYRQALQTRTAACPACGSSLQASVGHKAKKLSSKDESQQIILHCPICNWLSNKSLAGLIMALPEAQKFWRQYPRLIILPGQEMEVHGSPAFLSRIRSITSRAELNVISKRDTFEVLEAHSNIPL